ncbi:MAG: hypothetical protein JKY62_16885 [Desulfocapsa sp.]|nr:hypothetical protein [Desulfocapsa sp.]
MAKLPSEKSEVSERSRKDHRNMVEVDGDAHLAETDPLVKIEEEMFARGFTTLWTAKPKHKQNGYTGITFNDKGKKAYLRQLAVCGQHAFSASCAGVSRSTVCKHKREDPIFAVAVEEAHEYFRSLLQMELIRRGVHGYKKQVLGGKNRDKIFELHEYDTRCLELLGRIHIASLNTNRLPSTANQTNIDNSQNTVVNNTFDLELFDKDELAMFKKLVESQAIKAIEAKKKAEEKVING